MRKPLIHTHCHLICCVYIKGCVSIHIVWCCRCWDRLIQEIKAMSKVSKIFYRFQCFKCYVCRRRRRWCLRLLCNTAYRVLLLNLLMSKVSKIVCTVYTVASRPCQEGKLFVTVQYLKSLPFRGLAVHHQSVREGSFVNFLGLVKLEEWLQARCTANPQFLKLSGCSATQ